MRLEQLHDRVLVQIVLVFNQEFMEVLLHPFEGDLELLDLSLILESFQLIHFVFILRWWQMSRFDLLNL